MRNKKSVLKTLSVSYDCSNGASTGIAGNGGQQTDVSRRLFGWLVRKFSKWTVVEVYYFDCSWYVVQVRQNLRTGYKHFSCKKIVKYHYGTKAENLTPARLEALVNGG